MQYCNGIMYTMKGDKGMGEFRKLVGLNLMLLRKEKGITMVELADKTGIATSTISRYENGSNMDINMLETLVNACGMKIDIFFKNVVAKMQ